MTQVKTIRFQPESKTYHYSFTPASGLRHAVIKLHVSAKRLAAFRASETGAASERHVDILDQGNGWYEITGRELQKWNPKHGEQRDGAVVWIKRWNLFFLQSVKANPAPAFNLERVHKIQPVPVQSGRKNVDRRQPAWRPTPEQLRDQERLQSKVAALAARFGK
jgi:hypothetical protein